MESFPRKGKVRTSPARCRRWQAVAWPGKRDLGERCKAAQLRRKAQHAHGEGMVSDGEGFRLRAVSIDVSIQAAHQGPPNDHNHGVHAMRYMMIVKGDENFAARRAIGVTRG